MGKFIDLTGQKFTRLTVVELIKEKKDGVYLWLCNCICGGTCRPTSYHLRSGHTKSCGCLKIEKAKNRLLTHGMSSHSAYHSWWDMMNRCYNSKHKHFKNWGGRGIKVCEYWHKLENFIEDMGERPAGLTLERKDNNGNYELKNCIWATMKEQGNNRSDNRLITYKGKTKTLKQWSEITGIQPKTLQCRLKKWSTEKAFTEPINTKCRRKGTKKFSQTRTISRNS